MNKRSSSRRVDSDFQNKSLNAHEKTLNVVERMVGIEERIIGILEKHNSIIKKSSRYGVILFLIAWFRPELSIVVSWFLKLLLAMLNWLGYLFLNSSSGEKLNFIQGVGIFILGLLFSRIMKSSKN